MKKMHTHSSTLKNPTARNGLTRRSVESGSWGRQRLFFPEEKQLNCISLCNDGRASAVKNAQNIFFFRFFFCARAERLYHQRETTTTLFATKVVNLSQEKEKNKSPISSARLRDAADAIRHPDESCNSSFFLVAPCGNMITNEVFYYATYREQSFLPATKLQTLN